MKRLTLIVFAAANAYAGEVAVLQSGFRIASDYHLVSGSLIELHTKLGTVNLPADKIVRFEQEEYIAPPPPEPPAPVAPPPVVKAATPKEIIHEAARRNGLRPEFVQSVAAVESNFQTAAISPKGAIGLMQLMPGTAAALGVDPRDPAQNADAGARYLRQLLARYKDSPDPVRLALAAYNAGPGAVDRHKNVPPYRETQVYVEKVLKNYLSQLK
ncbi:MAG: lytic transglycosylase domain-containing protein [Bryobacteraceae bacterium]